MLKRKQLKKVKYLIAKKKELEEVNERLQRRVDELFAKVEGQYLSGGKTGQKPAVRFEAEQNLIKKQMAKKQKEWTKDLKLPPVKLAQMNSILGKLSAEISMVTDLIENGMHDEAYAKLKKLKEYYQKLPEQGQHKKRMYYVILDLENKLKMAEVSVN